LAAAALSLVSCGGGGSSGEEASPPKATGAYFTQLPKWSQFSPPLQAQAPTVVSAQPVPSTERIGLDQYSCLSRRFSVASTPDKIVMFSPDRELLWPGAMLQGRSHRSPLGGLLGLPIKERAPIKVSIPSLVTGDNFRVVRSPDQAETQRAVGQMIDSAIARKLVPSSSVEFNVYDYKSEQAFALQASLSGKYLGFKASASASVNTAANERTVMVHFIEKMFEVVVEPPETPEAFFSDDFYQGPLDRQVELGRLGPDNLPLYVSSIVYGRMMAFTMTSTASSTDIKAALSAAYKDFVNIEGSVKTAYEKTLAESRISITSLGGPAAATAATIASGNWQAYFGTGADLSTATPISYTFRNLGDGAIAKVQETTEYDVKDCTLAGGAGFVLDSFESDFDAGVVVPANNWKPAAASPSEPAPITLDWRDAATPQSLYYGYLAVEHTNRPVTDLNWVYDVGYIDAPTRFKGDKSAFYRGELSFWYKPSEVMKGQQLGVTRYCWTHWILYFPPIWETRCALLPVPLDATVKLQPSDEVFVYDSRTSTDQIVLRGGGTDAAGTNLTLTYNPKESLRKMSQGWQKLVLDLRNDDNAGALLCDPANPRGCWLVEDRIATEAEIRYVLSKVQDFRIRASYPVYRTCQADAATPGAPCPVPFEQPVPLGFVGGYFDEIKITMPAR